METSLPSTKVNIRAAKFKFRVFFIILLLALFLSGAFKWTLRKPVYAAGNISGTVYRDFNANGTRDTSGTAPNLAIDSGVQGVVVTAYDSSGTQRGTTTTGATGAYTLAASGTGPYRIEFTSLPAGYFPAPSGTNNSSTVRFVPDGNSSNIDLGILKPSDYSQNNPFLVTPCYINGNNTGADDVLVAYKYDRTGAVQHISLSNQIGSTWGLAWRARTRTMFAAAVLKRQTGFGPGKDGTRGNADDISSIYVIDYSNPGGNGTGTVVSAQTINVNSFSGVNVGANPRVGTTPANDLAGNSTPSHDYNVVGNVGKLGIGGIALSEDGNTLYVVSLNSAQRQLISLNVSNLNSVTLNSVTNIPNPGCPGTDSWSPWAVRVKDGEVYVGTVCTADVSQNAQNLRAYVQRLSGSSFVNVDLDSTVAADYLQLYYDRTCKYYNTGSARCDRAEWTPWDDNFTFVTIGTQRQVTGVQPILSDIEFDADGAMVLGLMDRRGHMHGTANYSPTAGDTLLYEEISAGTIYKLCNVSGAYVPEGKSGCSQSITPPFDGATDPAPGAAGITNTFYNNYSASSGSDGHGEIFFGGLANIPGAREIVATVMNPGPNYYSGGWRWFNATTGASVANFTLYTGSGGTTPVLGKANGLGDTVLLTDPAPLQIGNRVWHDADGDGVQGAGENSIQNVVVDLWADTNGDGTVDTRVGSATTDANGNYYFGGSSNANMLSSCTGTPVSQRIIASSDDAEEAGGTVSITSTTLELGYNTTPAQNTIGLRFTNLAIPDGARITNATVQFTANGTDSSAVTVNIQGEATANSTTFTTATNDITARLRTGSAVSWSPGAWTSGTSYTSPNIASVIQEIVNTGGWASGNSLNLIISNNGTASPNRRRSASFNTTGTNNEPLLSVTYDCPYSVTSNTAYEVRIATGQAALTATPALTTSNGDGNSNGDSRDSDPVVSGSNAVVAFTTGINGANDHTFDFGFLPAASAVYSIGNRVFFDTNNNGIMDGGEVGIDGVTVQLLDGSNNVLNSQTTTTAGGNAGYYRFDSLAAGTYKIRIAAANFTGTGALVGYQNSANATSGTDQRDNGTDPVANNPSTAGVVSANIVLGNGPLPLSEPDFTASGAGAHAPTLGDVRDDLTVDFGFYKLCLGNLVWVDTTVDGTYNSGGELGLAAATVKLYQADGTTEVPVGPDGILGTADDTTGATNQLTTAASGTYSFCGLVPGSYVIKVTPPLPYRSTNDATNSSTPDGNTDNDDNGIGIASGQASSATNATAIALTAGAEPTVTNATGTTTNNTMDFGFALQAPTLVKFMNCEVKVYDSGTSVEWQTGYEIDNLGFNLHKEEQGQRVQLNDQLIAGTALVAGSGVAMSSGATYAWWDKANNGEQASFWVEAIDLNGTSEWFGPFYPKAVEGALAMRTQSLTVNRLGNVDSTDHPLETTATATGLSIKQTKQVAVAQAALASSQAGLKLFIKEEGWYRITQADIAAAGVNLGSDTQLLQLYVDGQEQPIKVISDKDGLAVEFYGVAANSPYSTTRTYYLVSGARPGLRIQSAKGEGKATQLPSFPYTIERKDRFVYFSALKNGDQENFFGSVVTTASTNQTLTVRNLVAASEAGELCVALQGVTNVQHVVNVQINGVTLGAVLFNSDGKGVSKFTVPPSVLREGQNVVNLASQGGSGDMSLVDAIQLTYPHAYAVDNDALKITAKGGEQTTLAGFSNTSVQVFDVTNGQAPIEVSATVQVSKSGAITASFTPPGTGKRSLLVITAEKKKIATYKADEPSNLRSLTNQADFIIIARKEMMQTLEALKNLRQGQGLTTMIVNVEDIYDEFSLGQKTPYAVKEFLALSKSWQKAPRYVMFAGDTSYDPKNYLGYGDLDVVPTKLVDTLNLETASDDWLADFNNDGIADLSIGRLPARTAGEAQLMVAKIVAYESAAPSQDVLLVADSNDGFDFEAASDELKNIVGRQANVTQLKRGQVDAQTAKKILLDNLNKGPKVVAYDGHGATSFWRGNLLTYDDADALTNRNNLSVYMMMTCLNGYYSIPYLESLAEGLMKTEGGAVAVWASSAITEPGQQTQMNRNVFTQLFSSDLKTGNAVRVGDAVKNAKATITDKDIRYSWVFFGDPTMKLK
ncbi:MAG: C25 family cysteine peptidase [Acidobacteriota bacterium]